MLMLRRVGYRSRRCKHSIDAKDHDVRSFHQSCVSAIICACTTIHEPAATFTTRMANSTKNIEKTRNVLKHRFHSVTPYTNTSSALRFNLNLQSKSLINRQRRNEVNIRNVVKINSRLLSTELGLEPIRPPPSKIKSPSSGSSVANIDGVGDQSEKSLSTATSLTNESVVYSLDHQQQIQNHDNNAIGNTHQNQHNDSHPKKIYLDGIITQSDLKSQQQSLIVNPIQEGNESIFTLEMIDNPLPSQSVDVPSNLAAAASTTAAPINGQDNASNIESNKHTDDLISNHFLKTSENPPSSQRIHISDISNGPLTKFGTGTIANLAHGSIVGTAGNTVVLSTIVQDHSSTFNDDPSLSIAAIKKEEVMESAPEIKEPILHLFSKSIEKAAQTQIGNTNSMIPLTIDYRERYHGAGKIPSNRSRRDNSRATDQEILAARAIDRALRPLLGSIGGDSALNINCSVQSCDHHRPQTHTKSDDGRMGRTTGGDPIALAINSASAGLLRMSDVQFAGPVGCIKVCLMRDGNVLFDPTSAEVENSRMELLLAGTKDKILMMEFGSRSDDEYYRRQQLQEQQQHGSRGIVDVSDWDKEDPGVPEAVINDMICLAHAAIQPIIEAQLSFLQNDKVLGNDLKEGKDQSSIVLNINEFSDTELALDLGIPITTQDSGKSYLPLLSEIAENASDVGAFNSSSAAEHLVKEAFEFVSDKLDLVSLKLFGYDNKSIDACVDSDSNRNGNNANQLVNVQNKNIPLISKKIRGRRETLMYSEVKRLIRDEFAPSDKDIKQFYDYIAKSDSGSSTIQILCDSISARLLKRGMCESATKYGCRGDGRGRSLQSGLHTIRPISATVPLLPDIVHGSALFSRGETQVLCTATLGAPKEGQPVSNPYKDTSKIVSKFGDSEARNEKGPYDDLPVGSLRYLRSQMALESDLNSKKIKAEREMTGDTGTLGENRRFFLHYDFPAYSTGTIQSGRMDANRRAIGHGNLAEKGILPALPSPSTFPYAIRLTAEVTSSNGSSSMASVCGATLALLDAGVPLKAPVAGVSVGFVSEDTIVKNDRFYSSSLLLDITGTEDHYGKMDFKIAGTANGVTAMQLDVKEPLDLSTILDAMELAREGRRAILKEMENESDNSSYGIIQKLRPRSYFKQSAPRVEVVRFNPVRKRDLVGPGGAILRQLEDRYGVSLDLSQEGQCLLHGDNADMVSKAKSVVMDLVADVEEGGIYEGTVIEIKDFGAVIELLRNKEGLLHVSELTDDEISNHPEGCFGVVKDYLKVGQTIQVMCTGVDPVQGSIKLSRKKLLRQKRIQ